MPFEPIYSALAATVGVVALSLLLLGVGARPADAAIARASLIDGPGPTVLDVDGAAMAPDGSGGIVYRKLVGGQAHVYVSSFRGGAWQPPMQADAGQPFGASSPAIAAGNGGRLLVVWTEPWAVVGQATQYELMSAELAPGATSFAAAVQVDAKNIGDGSAADPSLAMAPNGNAYVVYRVVTQSLSLGSSTNIVPLRPGDELLDVRVAHYAGNGLPWSALGAINQFPQLTMRRPGLSNAPVIGVSNLGDGVVVWQEPDSSGAARIWARRIFGNTLGDAVEVSANTAAGQPISVDADAPALSVNSFGAAKIAYRLAGGPGSPYGSARIFVNGLPPDTATNANKLAGLQAVASAATLGVPSVSLEAGTGRGDFRLAYASGAQTDAVTGDEYSGNQPPISFGPATSERVPATIGQNGGGVSAWRASGRGAIDAREDFSGGAWQLAQFSAPVGGPADEPVLGGSGSGDALIAFRQGPPGESEVLAAVAKGPPGSFLASGPVGWVKPRAATLSWSSAPEAFGATGYTVLVDGQPRLRGLTSRSARLSPTALGDGVHNVQVVATDSLGQQTATPMIHLKVDANPPRVSVRRLGGGRVRVTVVDRASGALARDTRISFGDGATVAHKLSVSHRYSHAGSFTIAVGSEDRVGNRVSVHLRVRVP